IAVRRAGVAGPDLDLGDPALALCGRVLVPEQPARRTRLERLRRQRDAVDSPPRAADEPPDFRAGHVDGAQDRHAPVGHELVEARPGWSELDGRRVLLDDRAAALAATVDAGRLERRRRAVLMVLRPAYAAGHPAGGVGAVDQLVAVVVDHVGAVASLGPGRNAGQGGGGRRARRGGRRGRRRGGEAPAVTLVAYTGAVAAGGRARCAFGAWGGLGLGDGKGCQ